MDTKKELYRIQADFCKFLAHPKRIEILTLLGGEEMCVEDIASKVEVPVPNISQHLAMMRDRGIVEGRREGAHIYYRISHPKILQTCTLMKELMIELKQKQLEQLK